jgi:hypothetical protein
VAATRATRLSAVANLEQCPGGGGDGAVRENPVIGAEPPLEGGSQERERVAILIDDEHDRLTHERLRWRRLRRRQA